MYHLFKQCQLALHLLIIVILPVVVGEENDVEQDNTLCNNFDKLGELEAHLIRHRELFLSRQIETYKIDMVR